MTTQYEALEPVEQRMAFDHLMKRAREAEIDESSPARAVAGAQEALSLVMEGMKVASLLSNGAKSEYHVEVMLEAASIRAHLGRVLGDEAHLRDAMARCDEALRLSVELGTPKPRLEAEGLLLRGNLLATLGDLRAGLDHLREVVAVMQPAVEYFDRQRKEGEPAMMTMLEFTEEDTKSRELLEVAKESLAAMEAAIRTHHP